MRLCPRLVLGPIEHAGPGIKKLVRVRSVAHQRAEEMDRSGAEALK